MRSVVADLQAFSRVEPDRRVPCDLATVLQAAATNPVLGKPAPRARLFEAIEALAAAPGPTAGG